jgi:hypothetical protein
MQVMEGVVTAVSNCTPEAQLPAAVASLVGPVIAQLEQSLAQVRAQTWPEVVLL